MRFELFQRRYDLFRDRPDLVLKMKMQADRRRKRLEIEKEEQEKHDIFLTNLTNKEEMPKLIDSWEAADEFLKEKIQTSISGMLTNSVSAQVFSEVLAAVAAARGAAAFSK